MADYTKATGNGGSMMIRVGTSTVQFYVKAGSTQTYTSAMPYGWTVNGSTGSATISYPAGGAWLLCRTFTVTTTQTVTFRLGATGTSGLGGPTTFSVAVNRTPPATVPPAPDRPVLTLIGSTTLTAKFTGNGDGGSPIIRWEIAFTNLSTNIQKIITSTGTTNFVGMTPGVTYHFWARGVNAKGAGPWTAYNSATMLRVPDAPDPVVLSNVTQTSLTAYFMSNGNGGATVTQWQLGYGTSSTAPQISVTSNGTTHLTGLTPGATYYFWARGLNSVGWGPYSVRTQTSIAAGAYILVDGVWRKAVPYVRVAGVWRIAEPWGRVAGVWKKTG